MSSSEFISKLLSYKSPGEIKLEENYQPVPVSNTYGGKYAVPTQILAQAERYSKPEDLPSSEKPYNYFRSSFHEKELLQQSQIPSTIRNHQIETQFSPQTQHNFYSPRSADINEISQLKTSSHLLSSARSIGDPNVTTILINLEGF